MEFYFTSLLPDGRYIRTLTRFRLSDHKLMVEERTGEDPNCKQYETENVKRDQIFVPNFKRIRDNKSHVSNVARKS